MGWMSPCVLIVSKVADRTSTSDIPMETEPVGFVVDSDFILLENCCELERRTWMSDDDQISKFDQTHHAVADNHHSDMP
jgi:hypothetical protein